MIWHGALVRISPSKLSLRFLTFQLLPALRQRLVVFLCLWSRKTRQKDLHAAFSHSCNKKEPDHWFREKLPIPPRSLRSISRRHDNRQIYLHLLLLHNGGVRIHFGWGFARTAYGDTKALVCKSVGFIFAASDRINGRGKNAAIAKISALPYRLF